MKQLDDLLPPASRATDTTLQNALDSVVRDALKPIAAVLSGLFFFFAINHALVLPRSIAVPMIVTALLTSITMLVIFLLLDRIGIRQSWAQPVGTAIGCLVLSNGLLQLALSGEARQSTNIALVLLGSGSFLLSWTWLVLIITLSLGGWLAVVVVWWSTINGSEWIHFGFMLLSTTLLALLIQNSRRRTLLRLERLRQLDVERQRKLEAALFEVQIANRAKSTFLATMSHEFRTPLNTIMGMTELLTDSDLTPDQRELTDMVLTSSQQLLDTVTQILQMTQLESGEVIIENIEFLPKEMLTIAVETIRPLAHVRGLRLITNIDPTLPEFLRGDPRRIQQILRHLLDNAVKFTEQGEVRAAVSIQQADTHRVAVRFTVSDTGIGIQPTAGRQLWEPFTQADQSTTRKHGGAGLGLAISKRLVELMHGRIGFESSPSVGSTFWFEISLERVSDDR